MNKNSMPSALKVVKYLLEKEFKDAGKYLDFFERSIEAEKYKGEEAALRFDDEMFQYMARYDSQVSFPSIHSNALFIFMYSSFERMFCLTSFWLLIGENKSSEIAKITGYNQSLSYLESFFANGELFASAEWKYVKHLKQVRNYLAHGGKENLLGLRENSRYLRAAMEINSKVGEAFVITKSSIRTKIEPNQSAARVAMACYKDFLFLLIKMASEGSDTPLIEKK